MKLDEARSGEFTNEAPKRQARGAPEIDIIEAMPGDAEVYYDMPYACAHNCSTPDARTMQRLNL